MSTLQEWIAKLVEESAKGPLPDVNVTFPPQAPLHDAPDANLAVLVEGINPARMEATKRVLIEEIVVAAPDGDAKRIALANISRANALLEFGFATECQAYSRLTPFGTADAKSPPIANTLAAASRDPHTGQDVYRTVAQYRDAINALAASTTDHGQGFGA